MKKQLSIVVPYHQEGKDFIMTAITQIHQTIDVEDYEIIIVDDGSIPAFDINWIKDSRVKVIRHLKNVGVGAAFDTGAEIAESDNLFLMGSDIRFLKNNWASKIIYEINQYPKSFTCTTCVCLNADNMDMEKRRLTNYVNGATIIMFHDQKSNPRMTPSFRGIIEAQWLPKKKDRGIDSYEIPCILGAAYGVSKAWYKYVDGWWGHMLWGTLEPYISLKSWFFGGSCRTAPIVETGHIFKRVGTHGTPQDILLYNKMMVATILFENNNSLIDFFGTNSVVVRAKKIFENKLNSINEKKIDYKKKIIIDPNDYFKRWNIDTRGLELK